MCGAKCTAICSCSGQAVAALIYSCDTDKLKVLPEQHSADLKCWAPLVLEDVKADASKLVNVRVVNLGQKAHLWGMEAKLA